MNRRRSGLFRKYLAFILLLVTVELVASGAINLYFSFQESREALVKLQREKALSAAARIEHFLRDIESQLGWTALPLVAPGQSPMEARRLDFLKLLRQVPAITEITHLDGQGREQLKVSRLAMDAVGSGIDFSKDPRFIEARKGKAWFGPVYFRKETEPYMAIAIPEARDRPGVTVVDVNLKFIWDVVSRIRIGQEGQAYVVDSKGFLIAHPDISQVLKKVDLSALPQVRDALAQDDKGEWKEPADSRDLNGKSTFSAWAGIEATGWKVFVEQPTREVFAPLYDAILRTVLLLIAGGILAFLVAIFLARRMVNPVRALQEGAERIGAGDLGQRIEVHTGDELETLAERFNAMAAQLSESYSTLEQKVADRTAELTASLAQQTATAEILKVISSSPTDVQPVFEAIVRAARDLGQADSAYAFLFDGTHIRYVANIGTTDAWLQMMRGRPPWTPTRGTLSGRVVLDRANVCIEDKLADAEYGQSPAAATTGRRLFGVPMFREGKVIGVLSASWQEPGPVPEKLEHLLQTFAAQAVIAIENVRLFQELGQRNADLSETLEQQTATAEILRVISSSPTDVTPVFQAISNAARELGGAQEALVARYDGEFLSVAASTLNAPEDIERRKSLVPWKPDRTTLSGRVVLDRAPVEIPDIRIDSDYDRHYLAEDHPNQRALGVPMLREGEPVGSLNIWWSEPGEVQPKFVRLLQTFADQAVIAVENVRLFNEIQDKSRQLEAANRHKSEFLANMSHELRTPLNAIIGFSDVMLSGMTGALEEKPKEFIGDIRDSGKHLLNLINDILDLSKIEAGRMDLDVSRFDLRSAIDNALTLVKGRADRHGIQLETRIAPEVGDYDGDERKFKQIVLNLMSNAVKFTPEGGMVTLSAARANGAYEIAVTDTGIGIAPEDQLVIFEEFRQVGSDYARKAEGTGLGLTLTRRLVELHGGTLVVRSAPGQGSTFTFTLPIGNP